MLSYKYIILLFFTTFFFYSNSIEANDQLIVARIGNRIFTIDELKREIRIYTQKGDFNQKLLTLTPEGRKKILDQIITQYTLHKAAIEAQTHLDEQIEAYLSQLRRTLLVQKYIQNTLLEHPITEAELNSYWDDNREDFVIPEKRKVRQIIVSTKARAEELHDQLGQGAAFEDLAISNNIDESKETSGDLGWLQKGVMVDDFDNIVFNLPVGSISPVFETRFGYHIVKVENIRERILPEFEKMKEIIKKRVENIRLQKLINNLKREYEIEINYELFQKTFSQGNQKQ